MKTVPDEKNKEACMVFLKELTDILESLNIKLDQIVPGKKEKKGKIIKIPYQLQFKCDYEKLGDFVTELEKNNRIILIDQLIIKNDIEKTRGKGSNQKEILDQKGINCEVNPANIDEDKIKESLLKEKATPSMISKNLADSPTSIKIENLNHKKIMFNCLKSITSRQEFVELVLNCDHKKTMGKTNK